MLNDYHPQTRPQWKQLSHQAELMKNTTLKELFDSDVHRFDKFSCSIEDKLLLDYSKNFLTEAVLEELIEFAVAMDLNGSIEAMFSGEKINRTEDRAVLHTVLRDPCASPFMLDGLNIKQAIHATLGKLEQFSDAIINGNKVGYTGKAFTDIVNIGIGGSDLGPYMVCEALTPYKNHLKLHFVSNVDGTHLAETVRHLNHETTLFLIASKTFTTQETMMNAESARMWFLDNAQLNSDQSDEAIARHFVAISANLNRTLAFGISAEHQFPFWDFVGGRYSLWSAIGLPIALSVGFNNFQALLHGAHKVDVHFKNQPFRENIPVLLGLIGFFYNQFFDAKTETLLPYDQYLHRFPAYFQQANMESNGKGVDRLGNPVTYPTGPVVWGEPGTNGQHAFYQLLHQGTHLIPCDFIAPMKSHNPLGDHHRHLLANFFAQTQALAFGKSAEEVRQDLGITAGNRNPLEKLVPFKAFSGNRPSNALLVEAVTPETLGMLIAIYEHKIFTQGMLLNIYSFDQFGVELGKELANKIMPELEKRGACLGQDSSTNGQINWFKQKNTT